MNYFLRISPGILAIALAGCSGAPAIQLARVSGRAMLGDKALGRVTIQLVPDQGKGTHAPTGAGQTEEDGTFSITSPPHGAGVVPGHYKVTVTSYTGKDVPRIYGDPTSTPLEVEIPSGGLENWELKLKPN